MKMPNVKVHVSDQAHYEFHSEHVEGWTFACLPVGRDFDI